MIYVCSLKKDNSYKIAGLELIQTIEELYKVAHLEETKEITLLPDFIDRFFTPEGVTSFIDETKQLNKYIKIHIDSNYIRDYDIKINELSKIKSFEDFINHSLKNRDSIMKVIGKLCDSYEGYSMDSLNANNKLSTIHLETMEMSRKYSIVREENEQLQSLLNEVTMQLDTLVNRINYNYEKNIDKTKFMGTVVEHRKFSKILYIKEITRVKYVDTYIYYLQEILKTLYGVPTRLVVIEAPYANHKKYLYKSCKDFTNLSFSDVFADDIFTAGYHGELMEDILNNPSRVEFLIVLDRSAWRDVFIKGDGVEYLYTASDLDDVRNLVQLDRIISYNPDTLHIVHIDKFQSLTMEDKISKYSSMQIVKASIELLERS